MPMNYLSSTAANMNGNVCLKNYSLLIWMLFIGGFTFFLSLKLNRDANISTEGRFWVFTDSHVDLSYRHDGDPASHCRNMSTNNMTKPNRKFGHFDCDAPSELLMSALSAAKGIDSNVDFIIWLGDASSHISSTGDTIKSGNENLSQQLRKHFPKTLIFPVLGNHDILLKTNQSLRFKEFYNETKYNLLLNDTDAVQTFLKGGYYSIRMQTLQDRSINMLRIVVLNTVMFQAQYIDFFEPREAIEQIEWFNKTISDASNANDRMLILVHVPFGINENLLFKFYDIRYEQMLISLIKKYSANIVMCFSGHRHRDVFRVYSTPSTKVGIIGHPSISPIGSLSQPSIRKYSYDRKSLVLIDYEQYSLNLLESERTQKDEWRFSYRFSSWYCQSKGITSKSLSKLVYLIRTNAFYLKRFLLVKHNAETVQLNKNQIVHTLCALTLFNFDEFMLCTRTLRKKHIQYDNIIINNSLEKNFHMNEQLMEYRIIYRRVAISFYIFIIIFLSIIYRIYLKYFHKNQL